MHNKLLCLWATAQVGDNRLLKEPDFELGLLLYECYPAYQRFSGFLSAITHHRQAIAIARPFAERDELSKIPFLGPAVLCGAYQKVGAPVDVGGELDPTLMVATMGLQGPLLRPNLLRSREA
ncbi:uncharacterized protein TRIVIDRAFT_203428 [Trichoderma virens Gv29-8]|uniref:Uncharacterized protein n=1 Tax=Hypocrea virens (strain Gv29-8 / FGSC 10586) TaxID=413071 RepID=G9N0H8_HYPVG|nr:uncharacterized protein TRIVIDRAFT_203428 [Trichoderma virens Gv29-8]EHK19860.1 hypothetical protein TRIVIDRAFT_203428 [Trichoderma virens Gv29-8]